ncbi:GNAT family N-acetyltransferase [Nonomuraea africana]|uniref:Ribosomal protein S18 acetylase RimI-like enzyme n=1 Tax=Nonomuraea africana TaxID=46171 RepID=A0ABR9KCE4_9ACTN|nr:GNAT family N-acetyltransferase [Nonomuraea africana]MBE1559681.1 ribosomal protein S18 acetylase RimI-like enzyme [Nonomuraea africana]
MHAYLRSVAGARARRVGPFTVRFDECDAALSFNYAIPDDGAAPTAGEVAALVAAFRERARTPRLEYVPRAAPEVEGALLAAGFRAEGRFPVLVCRPEEVVDAPVSGAVRVGLVRDDSVLWQVARVMNEAFEAPEATEHDVARLRRVLDGGGLVAAAVDEATGEVVGAGQIGSPHGGVAEVAGIAVRASHRRRGIAGAVTALLTRAGGDAGIAMPFLTPADEAAAQVYARVGYRKVSEALFISLR